MMVMNNFPLGMWKRYLLSEIGGTFVRSCACPSEYLGFGAFFLRGVCAPAVALMLRTLLAHTALP